MVYEYPSNFSGGTVVDGIGTFIQYADHVSSGWLGYAFLLVIAIMTFGLSIGSGSRKGLAFSSLICFLFSVYFWRLGMVGGFVPGILLVTTVATLIGAKEDGGKI